MSAVHQRLPTETRWISGAAGRPAGNQMYRVLADLVVALHMAFVVFVLLGGLLVLRWPKIAFLHLPAAVWGAAIEFGGWICPLTPLENSLRRQGDQEGYSAGFIEHYILPVLYPSVLTRDLQLFLGLLVITINLAIYVYLYRKMKHN